MFSNDYWESKLGFIFKNVLLIFFPIINGALLLVFKNKLKSALERKS